MNDTAYLFELVRPDGTTLLSAPVEQCCILHGPKPIIPLTEEKALELFEKFKKVATERGTLKDGAIARIIRYRREAIINEFTVAREGQQAFAG